MNRKTLRLFTVALSVVIAVLAASALDRLPSSVRAQIDSERAALNSARNQLHTGRDQVGAQVQSDPALFGAIPFGGAWPGRFDQAATALDSAGPRLQWGRGRGGGQVQSAPGLCGAIPFGGAWPGRFDQAATGLDSAGRDMDELTRLEKHNRHTDAAQAKSVLESERHFRTGRTEER